MNLSSLAAGTYTLQAKAIDGQSAETLSATRTITVSDANLAPVVSITSPTGGANFPSAPAGFTLSATAGAGEVNGSIQRVEFYVNGNLVNTDTAGPWSYAVSGLANGTYTLTAKAFDQLDAETTSAPITVTVGSQPKLHFIHVDHLNTPRLVANAQQQTVWRWDQQEPFGVNVPDENPSGLGAFDFPLRFPGQYFDKEDNLAYNYFRDYDPAIGRYVESDPIGLRGGLNTYSYVGNKPLMRVDPFGLFDFPGSEGLPLNPHEPFPSDSDQYGDILTNAVSTEAAAALAAIGKQAKCHAKCAADAGVHAVAIRGSWSILGGTLARIAPPAISVPSTIVGTAVVKRTETPVAASEFAKCVAECLCKE